MSPRPLGESSSPSRVAARLGLTLALALVIPALAAAQATGTGPDADRVDITGRQNLTLGAGARAYGMGGAFLARADDATAASWNPAGLSYLRLPELSLVGAFNEFAIERPQPAIGGGIENLSTDHFQGWNADFAAFTWPVAVRDVRGAVQLSYQRAISFDGTRQIRELDPTTLALSRTDDAQSDGGFDVVALGTGLRLTRRLRAGVTLNRWFNGYSQTLKRNVSKEDVKSPLREFDLDFGLRGWNVNLGLVWSPWEALNLGAVYKTPFTAKVELGKSRRDTWVNINEAPEVTTNSYSSDQVRLEFPSSFGFGVSWRPRDTLTVSADLTRTRWSQSRILGYFTLDRTGPSSEDGVPAPKLPPVFQPPLQYPTLTAVPASDDPEDPARLSGQHDKDEIRLGAEWVLIKGAFRIPLRAGYFNDQQIVPDANGDTPRFNCFTAGIGIALGSVLLDFAYVYEFGEYYQTVEAAAAGADVAPGTPALVRNALRTNRVFGSLIYRFGGRR